MSRAVITEQALRRGSDRGESGGTPASSGPSIPLMRNLDSEAIGLGVMGRAQGLGAAGIISHTQPVQLPPVPTGGASFQGVRLPEVPQSSGSATSSGSAPQGAMSGGAQSATSRISSSLSSMNELNMPPASSPNPLSPRASAPASPPLTAPTTPFENVAAAAAQMDTQAGKGNVGRSADANTPLDNALSSIGQAQTNLGNLLQDTKKGINPVIQFGKELVKLVTGSMIAFINFFFKPKT